MTNYIYGKNAIREAISNSRINKLFVTDAKDLEEIKILARKENIIIEKTTINEIEKKIGKGKVHQGVVASVNDYKYYSLDEIVTIGKKKYPLIVMLDGLEDPHNLGAILRTADAIGVDGIIIPKNRSVRLNDTVAKVSTGAIEYVKVCEVTNLTQTIKTLKEKGYWIVASEKVDGASLYTDIKYDMPVVLIIGSEGKGISRLVLEQADFKIYLPMEGHVNSLNASVCCSILLYEINRNRKE